MCTCKDTCTAHDQARCCDLEERRKGKDLVGTRNSLEPVPDRDRVNTADHGAKSHVIDQLLWRFDGGFGPRRVSHNSSGSIGTDSLERVQFRPVPIFSRAVISIIRPCDVPSKYQGPGLAAVVFTTSFFIRPADKNHMSVHRQRLYTIHSLHLMLCKRQPILLPHP